MGTATSKDGLHFWHECISCGNHYKPDQFLYVCPVCKGLLLVARDEDVVAKIVGAGRKAQAYFDVLRYGSARRHYPNDSGVFLWRDFILPGFPEADIVSLKEGQTDLFEVPQWLARETGVQNLYIKMEGQAPSESFKDRGMPVAVSDALRLQRNYPELGIVGISCASTGDTSAAAAVYSAYVRDKLSCLVLVPHEKIADSQMFQAVAHGAQVMAIEHPDGFDGCMGLIQEYTARHPERILVNSKNDMRIVGQETIGLEIIQDLAWQPPDWIAIPVGNGGNLTALLNGLLRAKRLGLIDRVPGIIAGQTAAADTLVRWQESNYSHYEPGTFQDTVATAMNINAPVSFPRIQKLHDTFDLHFFRSSEEDITGTWAQFMRGGANICPQGAVSLHAVQQARDAKLIKPTDVVVAISTASALKFIEAGIAYHKGSGLHANPYHLVTQGLEEIEQLLEGK